MKAFRSPQIPGHCANSLAPTGNGQTAPSAKRRAGKCRPARRQSGIAGADECGAKAASVALLVKLGFRNRGGLSVGEQADYDFVRWLIEENQIPDDVSVQVLVQAREDLIVRTYEALKG